MKRTILFFLITMTAAGLIFAQAGNSQGENRRGRNLPQPIPAENVTVTGNLTIAQGMIAVKSNDITYLLPGLNRFVGFIDSLKDGAQVKFEGTARSRDPDSKIKMVFLSKLTIGGKEYDFGQARPQKRRPGDITHYQMPQGRDSQGQGPQGQGPRGRGHKGRGQQGCNCPPQEQKKPNAARTIKK